MKTYEIIIQRKGSRTISADSREKAEEIAKSSNPKDFLYDDEINITDIYETDSNETLFRCEDESPTVMNPVDVISFEVFELGNTDILEYCLKRYISDNIKNYPEFTLTYDIIQAIINDDEVKSYWSDMYEDDFKQDTNPIIDFIRLLEKILKTKINYVLWLADKNAVETLYLNEAYEMKEYNISDIILSDLGFDGKLFAYTSKPVSTNKRR